jgi:serine/threonine protein phosphatase PrpC
MSNYNNGNKNKLKSRDKNSFLNTNYRQKNHQSKFNSIGKLISMNYPFVSNEKNKKAFSKNKNNINYNDNISNNNISKSPIPNILSQNMANNSKSENDLYTNISEKDLYGTIQNFRGTSQKKATNNINKVNVVFKDDSSQNQVSSLHNGDVLYLNYFGNNNKFQSTNYHPLNKISNQTHGIFFSRSSDKYKKLKANKRNNNMQDNKSNDSFGSQKNKENKLLNSSEFQKKKNILGDEIKKKAIKVFNSQEISNNMNNSSSNNYLVSNYGSYTLGGTDAFGHPKTNQDSYITKEENLISNNKEYTFGVFDGHGLQGHLVSEGIKNYLMNCTYDQYSSKQKIVSMFNSLSKTIENSKNFDVFCSGSTAVIVHVSKEKIICANCGDSRSILINGLGNIVKLSRDHKPELIDEKKRIVAAGGRVDRIYGMGPYRVWFKDGDYPGLAMSRSIGDTLAHKVGVSNIPEIFEYNTSSVKPFAIIVASDGVWEFMNNEQVKNILNKYKFNHDAYACSKEIVEKARQIWKGTSFAIDDITCVTVFFDKN